MFVDDFCDLISSVPYGGESQVLVEDDLALKGGAVECVRGGISYGSFGVHPDPGLRSF